VSKKTISPGGHVTGVVELPGDKSISHRALIFGALAAILTARIESKRVRVAIWIVSTLMFLTIGFSRIYLGVHHTTDVIAGFAAALIWILVVRFVEMQLRRRRLRKMGTGLT